MQCEGKRVRADKDNSKSLHLNIWKKRLPSADVKEPGGKRVYAKVSGI